MKNPDGAAATEPQSADLGANNPNPYAKGKSRADGPAKVPASSATATTARSRTGSLTARKVEVPEPPGLSRWMPDEATEVCLACKTPFSVFTRRHHCRRCLRIFCATCSPFRAHLAAYPNETVRICISCMKALADAGDEGAVRQQQAARPSGKKRSSSSSSLPRSSSSSSSGMAAASGAAASQRARAVKPSSAATGLQQLGQTIRAKASRGALEASGGRAYLASPQLGSTLASLWGRSTSSSSSASASASSSIVAPASPKLSFTEVADDTTLVDHRRLKSPTAAATSLPTVSSLDSSAPGQPSPFTLTAPAAKSSPEPSPENDTPATTAHGTSFAGKSQDEDLAEKPLGWRNFGKKWLRRLAILLTLFWVLRRFAAASRSM